MKYRKSVFACKNFTLYSEQGYGTLFQFEPPFYFLRWDWLKESIPRKVRCKGRLEVFRGMALIVI